MTRSASEAVKNGSSSLSPNPIQQHSGLESLHIKDESEYRAATNNNKLRFTTLSFTEEQVDCICDSLQQKRDVKKLEYFLKLYEAEKQPKNVGKASEAFMRAKAFVAFERGRYRELYNIIETREFESKFHPMLQDMWYRAHYKEAESVRGRALGKSFLGFHAL